MNDLDRAFRNDEIRFLLRDIGKGILVGALVALMIFVPAMVMA